MLWVRVAIAAIALSAVACGGGSGEADAASDAPIAMIDAGPTTIDASTPAFCDPVDQSGCNPGQKCSLIPGASPRIGCVADEGSIALEQPCTPATSTTPDLCAPGLVCRGQTTPVCQEFCDDSPTDTCSNGQTCVFDYDLDGDFYVDYELCGRSCEVLQQNCISGFGCYPSQGGEICAEEGAGDIPVAEGGECPYANSCEAGLGCFRLGASPDWLCFKLCQPGGNDCSPTQTCNPVADENWGLCIDAF